MFARGVILVFEPTKNPCLENYKIVSKSSECFCSTEKFLKKISGGKQFPHIHDTIRTTLNPW